MNKKQKILTIFGLGLILFLIGTPFLTKAANLLEFSPLYQAISLTQKVGSSTAAAAENAGTLIGGFSAYGINLIFQFIINAVGFIGGTLFSLAGALTNFTLSLNFDILNNPMIDVGWGISRDLANLGFVLFIIIIAIATILRIQQYEAKSTLGKLIAVALLVNFSLLFASVFIDFSNMLTNYFIQSITPSGVTGLGPSLANAFGIQNLLSVKDATEIGPMLALKGQYMVITSGLFVAAFTFLGALSLLALAVMFLVRYVILSILLILVPLAFLFIILPATKNLWDKWSKEFMKWIIFAPAASFFLYLAVYMTINYGKLMNNLATQSQGIGTADQMNFANLIINQPLQTIGRMVIVIGFLLGGLITANSMGIAGSKAFMGVAVAAGKGIRGYVGKKSQQGFSYLPRTNMGQKVTEKMMNTPGLRTIGRGISNFALGTGEKLIAEATAKQKNISTSRLTKILPSLVGVPLAAATARIAKEGRLKFVDQKFLNDKILTKQTQNAFKRYNMGPLYGDYIGKALGMGKNLEVKEAIDAGKIDEAKKLMMESFKTYDAGDFAKFKKYANNIYNDFDHKQFGFLGKDEASYKRTQNIISYGLSTANPGDISKIMSQLDPATFDPYIKSIIDSQIPDLEKWNEKERTIEKEMEHLKKLEKSDKKEDKIRYQVYKTINHAMDKRMLGELYEFPASPTTQT